METAGCTVPEKESPISNAMNKLNNAIGSVKETMNRFESTLASVLTNPEKPGAERKKLTGQTQLESSLLEMEQQVLEINEYLREVQNIVQL